MCINYENDYEEEFDEDSMPVPCQHCKGWFDLTDGWGSELWYPNTVICKSCHSLEEIEIERREDITEALRELENAEHTLKEWKYIEGEEEGW